MKIQADDEDYDRLLETQAGAGVGDDEDEDMFVRDVDLPLQGGKKKISRKKMRVSLVLGMSCYFLCKLKFRLF